MILANERHLGGLLRTTTYCGASLVMILFYCQDHNCFDYQKHLL